MIWSRTGTRDPWKTCCTGRTWPPSTYSAWKKRRTTLPVHIPTTCCSSDVYCYTTYCCSNSTHSRYPNSGTTTGAPSSSAVPFTRLWPCSIIRATLASSGRLFGWYRVYYKFSFLIRYNYVVLISTWLSITEIINDGLRSHEFRIWLALLSMLLKKIIEVFGKVSAYGNPSKF